MISAFSWYVNLLVPNHLLFCGTSKLSCAKPSVFGGDFNSFRPNHIHCCEYNEHMQEPPTVGATLKLQCPWCGVTMKNMHKTWSVIKIFLGNLSLGCRKMESKMKSHLCVTQQAFVRVSFNPARAGQAYRSQIRHYPMVQNGQEIRRDLMNIIANSALSRHQQKPFE